MPTSTVHHDLQHDIGSDPHAKESIAWNLLVPEERLFGFGYFTRRRDGTSTRILAIFDDDGDLVADIAEAPFEGEDLDDFTVAGMRYTQPERGRAMTVQFEGERLAIDYRFDGLFDPFLYGSHGDGCPPRVATDRFEQCGVIEGTLTVDGRAIPFHTTAHRDHSWGVRDYGALTHWNWVSAQAGPELAIHANHTWYQGKQFTNGYVFRDGLLSPVASMRIDATYDAQVLPVAADFTLVDEAGRTTRARSEYFAGGFITPFDDNFVWAETGHRFELEGQPGVGMFEQGWQSFELEHLRGGAYVERP